MRLVTDAAVMAVEKLLTLEGFIEYNEIKDVAWEKYEKVRANALAEYMASYRFSWALCMKVGDKAGNEELENVKDAAFAEFKKVTAHALVEIYQRGLKKS